jgi:hypothetical protein
MALALLFGAHGHQPVGNFPSVLETAHERCYRPFLRTLHRFPGFRFSLHFSGCLLDYLLARHADDMALLNEMVDRGQVELFGGGDCEPVLAAIPERDRIGQILALSEKLERRFGRRPTGAWLTERVWEPTVVPALADCGIRYVTVDDYHFLCAGKEAGELDGFHTTEENGRRLDIFPISEALRYRLPFSPAADAVAYLEQLADSGHAAAIYFDDIEKFGIWPETWDWVYGKRWLEDFVTGLLDSGKIRPATYREFHAGQRTRGVVYLPTASYIEMNEWALPAPAAEIYAGLVDDEKIAGRFDRSKAFLRGGIWRNFFTRYPESNWMHKRVLAASQRLAALLPQQRAAEMTAALYRAENNDAYWHGLFGGIYLPHLRRAVYRNLLELETALDAVSPRSPCTRLDLDYDGNDEVFLTHGELQAVARLDGRAALIELDSYALRHNFGDTLRRTHEHYHRKVQEGRPRSQPGGGIASAHDRVSFKHEIGAGELAPDLHGRGLFLDRWSGGSAQTSELHDYQLVSADPALLALVFRAGLDGGGIEKRYALEGLRLTVSYRLHDLPAGTLQTGFDVALPSCDGIGGRYILADGSIPCGFGEVLEQDAVATITLDDRELGGGIRLTINPPAVLRARPHHTISQSEEGFERIMQAAAIALAWPVQASGGEFTVTMEIYRDEQPAGPSA